MAAFEAQGTSDLRIARQLMEDLAQHPRADAFCAMPTAIDHAMHMDRDNSLMHGIASFGPFRLIAAERRLKKGDEPLQLGSRALDTLIVLAERAGEVVTQRELISHVWPDAPGAPLFRDSRRPNRWRREPLLLKIKAINQNSAAQQHYF